MKPVKLILIGNSGAGKTGSLAPLLENYELRLIMMDSLIGLEALRYHAGALQKNMEFVSYRDKYKRSKLVSKGLELSGSPQALVNCATAIDKWPTDGSKPEEWGLKKILVIDSLTMLGKAAKNWADRFSSNRDGRAIIGFAQEAVDKIIQTVTSDDFNTNVILISHIKWPSSEYDKDRLVGDIKGVISSVGVALGRELPIYVSTVLECKTAIVKGKAKRVINTEPTRLLDLKNPVELDSEYPIATGMLDIFNKLCG